MHVWKVIRRLGARLLLEMHLDLGASLVLILLWQADMWALISVLVCIMRSAPVCCKWVTPDAIFCVVVWRLLRVFVLFRSCSSKMYKTKKQLWSKISDTNMRVRHVVFLYY